MRFTLISFVLGVFLTVLLVELPVKLLLYLTILVAFGLTVAAGLKFRILMFPAMLLVGFSYGGFHGHDILDRLLPISLEGKDLRLEGEIDGLPLVRNGYAALLMRDVMLDGQAYPGRIRLGWQGASEVSPGQRWSLQVRLKRPSGFSSPGAMDYEGWLFRQQVIATGYVRNGDQQCLLEHQWTRIDWWRWQLAQFIDQNFQHDRAAVFKALLLGDKRNISQELWSTFSHTGTTHLLVISGLHIGLMALIGLWFSRGLAYSGLIPLERWPLPKVGAFLGCCFAFVYTLMAGFSIPAQRALIMLTVALSGTLLSLKIKPSTLFLVALAVVVLLDPLAVISNGFWYSFVAVASLLYAFSGGQSTHRISDRFIRPQTTVFIALAPLLALNMQPVSILSPLINLISIPFVGLLVVPMLFLGVILSLLWHDAGILLLDVCGVLLDGWVVGLEWVAVFDPGLPLLSAPDAVSLLLAMAGVIMLLAHPGLGLRWLALPCFLPWLLATQKWLPEGEAEVVVFDVGQGLAVLICTRHHCLVYDTGDRFSDHFTAAGAVMMPYLKHHTVGFNPETIVISHNDRDHRGGLETLLEAFQWARVYVPEPDDYPVAVSLCHDTYGWEWDGVRFRFLSQGKGLSSRNDRSCVLQVTAGQHTVLLTGDISFRAERRLVERYADELASQLLLVAHHGSASSTEESFLAKVKPVYASVSVGYRNRFNHPSLKVRERIDQFGSEMFETQITGTQVYRLGGESLPPPYCHRLQKLGYWSRKPLS
ncbi:MAG: DNA internalization-related competence protein ComEC/Rec2 [Endozoicomonadaceae bacterium]|nr:DNA internalization-related competence protein ComEC/Rec2 [Endozoicomonadaceae bacterium]